jgi:hypothetical protein
MFGHERRRLVIDPHTGQRRIVSDPVGYAPEAGAPVGREELRRHIAREGRGRGNQAARHAEIYKAANANFNRGNRQFREQQEREACAAKLEAARVPRSEIYRLNHNGQLTERGVKAYLSRNSRYARRR